jgi:hypothetical protein
LWKLISLGDEFPVFIIGIRNSQLWIERISFGIYPILSIDISRTCCHWITEPFNVAYILIDVCKIQFRNDILQCIIDKRIWHVLCCCIHNEIAFQWNPIFRAFLYRMESLLKILLVRSLKEFIFSILSNYCIWYSRIQL